MEHLNDTPSSLNDILFDEETKEYMEWSIDIQEALFGPCKSREWDQALIDIDELGFNEIE